MIAEKNQWTQSNNLDVSLIVPCYNEEKIDLSLAIKRLKKTLDLVNGNYEIIIIDDRSKDNTRERIKKLCKEEGNCFCYFNDLNIGRGGTVAKGVRLARGRIIGYIDIDLSIDPGFILPLLDKIDRGADMVIARRRYKLNIFSFHRWILTNGYRFLVKVLLNSGLGDTESGCKFFKKEKISPILENIRDKKWFWDTELVARSYLAGLKIAEVPVIFIRDSFHTSMKIIRDSLFYFIKLIRFSREFRNSLNSKK